MIWIALWASWYTCLEDYSTGPRLGVKAAGPILNQFMKDMRQHGSGCSGRRTFFCFLLHPWHRFGMEGVEFVSLQLVFSMLMCNRLCNLIEPALRISMQIITLAVGRGAMGLCYIYSWPGQYSQQIRSFIPIRFLVVACFHESSYNLSKRWLRYAVLFASMN